MNIWFIMRFIVLYVYFNKTSLHYTFIYINLLDFFIMVSLI